MTLSTPSALGHDSVAVIGAGPSGLAALKNLLAMDISATAFERSDEVGGVWHYDGPASSVYHSTHLISSTRQTEFVDFPMPDDYPAYPSRRQAHDYLRSYADRFALRDRIEFGRHVDNVAHDGHQWQVQVAGESSPRAFRAVVIANGHHGDPLYPTFPGEFTGEVIHSRQYKTPDILASRRVLVVGAGNSGCDIAVEAAQHASAAFLSMRRGYHFLPKFLRGKPIDVAGETLHRWGLPLWLRRAVARALIHVAVGPLENYGLPRPDHRLFESHPIVNSQLLYELGHGRIRVKPNISELRGREVKFVDGTHESIELIVYATGYRISFPFMDADLILDERGRPRLYLNAFHPQRDDLFVAGLIQPDSGLWGLADLQCRIMAHYLRGLARDPSSVAWFKQLKSAGRVDLGQGVRYLDSPRHALEVEYYGYRQRLLKLLRRFGDRL
jgi:cation diffusion facilitator CzcD-associated flavoprotein CzcO